MKEDKPRQNTNPTAEGAARQICRNTNDQHTSRRRRDFECNMEQGLDDLVHGALEHGTLTHGAGTTTTRRSVISLHDHAYIATRRLTTGD